MIQTLNKHVKWRKDNGVIFICDCKRLIDLKTSLRYTDFMIRLTKGINKEELNKEERLVFSDFEKMKLLSELKLESLNKKDFSKAMEILDNELGEERVRDTTFLYKKFKKFPQFFLGIFLDKELKGIICGFPRENYLLISEIAIDSRFKGRGFGKMLIQAFEKVAKGKYSQINVGAQDEVIDFYKNIHYKPFLLVQFEKEEYSPKDFKNFKILNYNKSMIEIKIKNCDLKVLKRLREKYPKANFQYIFTKKI